MKAWKMSGEAKGRVSSLLVTSQAMLTPGD